MADDERLRDRAGRALMHRATYPLAMALVSAAALVVEIVAGRLLAPYLGMSLYTWTAIIAVVLAGLSLGHWIGGVIDPGDRVRSAQRLASIVALAALATAAIPLVLRTVSTPLLAADLGAVMRIVLLVSVLFLLPSALAGMVSPILTRLALDAAPAARSRVLGAMFAAGALGSIAGTLAAGFLFITWLGTRTTLLAVAGVELALAVAFLTLSRPRPAYAAAKASLWVMATLALAGISARLDALASPCDRESGYFCIRVVDAQPQTGRPSRLMVLDHMVHSISDRDEPRWMHGSYMALMDRLVRLQGIADRPFQAFFIGGGALTLPRAWLASFPDARLVVAELDPEVTRIAREHFWLGARPELEVLHGDARFLLAHRLSGQRFDLVIGDAFNDLSVPAHLTTVEFARLVQDRLSAGGLYLLHIIDLVSDPRFMLSEVATLEQVFEHVEVWVDETQFASAGRITFVVRAGDAESGASAIRGASPDDLDSNRRWRRLDHVALARAAANGHPLVLTDDLAPVDRLMFHVLERDL